jgi:hypothetical protein
MEILESRSGGVLVVTLVDRLDALTAAGFSDRLLGARSANGGS